MEIEGEPSSQQNKAHYMSMYILRKLKRLFSLELLETFNSEKNANKYETENKYSHHEMTLIHTKQIKSPFRERYTKNAPATTTLSHLSMKRLVRINKPDFFHFTVVCHVSARGTQADSLTT